jgi:hypothetical protein
MQWLLQVETFSYENILITAFFFLNMEADSITHQPVPNHWQPTPGYKPG